MTVGSPLNAGGAGRDLVAADVAIGAGWGGTATFAIAPGSNRSRGLITVTASATTPAQATATVTITFPEAFADVPVAITSRDQTVEAGDFDTATAQTYVDSVSKTQLVLQTNTIPTAAKKTGLAYAVIG